MTSWLHQGPHTHTHELKQANSAVTKSRSAKQFSGSCRDSNKYALPPEWSLAHEGKDSVGQVEAAGLGTGASVSEETNEAWRYSVSMTSRGHEA